MPTLQQIEQFKKKARARGFSEAQIASEVARKQQEEAKMMASSSKPSQIQPSTQTNKKQTAIDKAGSFVKDLASPFINTGRNILDATILTSQVGAAKMASKKNPEKGAKIAQMDILGSQKRAKEFDTGKTGKQALTSEKGVKQLKKQTKDSLNIASYAVPFGKARAGAGLVERVGTKTLIPGAVSGTLQGVSEEDATIESVIGSAVFGGVSAGALEGIANLFKGANKFGKTIKKAGEEIRVGSVTKKPSISGARMEKEIQNTLKEYGVKGTTQDRYAMAEGVVKDITRKIDKGLVKSTKQITAEEIRDTFLKKVSKSVREGDISIADAEAAFDKYFSDVSKVSPEIFITDAQGQVKINTRDVFELKKDLQSGMSTLYKKLANGNSLTATQKIVKSLRDTLDDLFAAKHPELKKLTMDQSRLYEAVDSLGRNRKTVPTARIGGTTIPRPITEKIIDKSAAGMEKIGAGIEGNTKLVQKIPEGVGGLIGSRTPDLLAATDQSQEDIQDVQGYEGEYDSTGDIQHDLSIAEDQSLLGEEPVMETHPIFGNATKRDILLQAFQSGLNQKQIDEIEAIYDRFSETSGGIVDEETQKAASSLRTEYLSQTKQNGYMEAITSKRKIDSTPETAAGDISLVFAYMKLLDPASTVRESEQSIAQNATSLSGQFQNYAQKVGSGKRLNSKQRQEFREAADAIFTQYETQQNQIDNLYRYYSKRYGIDPSLIGVGAIGIGEE